MFESRTDQKSNAERTKAIFIAEMSKLYGQK